MFSLMRVKNMRAVLALCVALTVSLGPVGSHVFAAVDSNPASSSAGDVRQQIDDLNTQIRNILNTPVDFCDPAAMDAHFKAWSRVDSQKRDLERLQEKSHPTIQQAVKAAVSAFADEGLLADDPPMVEDYEAAMRRGDTVAANALMTKMAPREQAQAAEWSNNYALAFKILTPMADQGDVKAQRRLALIYSWATNFSVPTPAPRDDTLAFKYARLASLNGDEPAQVVLARAYACGFGMKKDLVKAYAWFSLALSQSSLMLNTDEQPMVILRQREFIATEMSHDDIQRAKHLLITCYQSRYKACD